MSWYPVSVKTNNNNEPVALNAMKGLVMKMKQFKWISIGVLVLSVVFSIIGALAKLDVVSDVGLHGRNVGLILFSVWYCIDIGQRKNITKQFKWISTCVLVLAVVFSIIGTLAKLDVVSDVGLHGRDIGLILFVVWFCIDIGQRKNK